MVRKACALHPNVLSGACPTRQVLDLIADKWTTLIIYLLASGKHRYGELHKRIEGISQKMLTQTLRQLEDDGLVSRRVYPEVPPRTEYADAPGRNAAGAAVRLVPMGGASPEVEGPQPQKSEARGNARRVSHRSSSELSDTRLRCQVRCWFD